MLLGVLLVSCVSFAVTAVVQNSCSENQLECEDDTCISLNNNCASVDREYGEECTIWTAEVRWLRCINDECDSTDDGSCDDIKTCHTIKPRLLNSTRSKINPCVLPSPGPHMSYLTPSWSPGQKYDYLFLEYICAPGYNMIGKKYRFCSNGKWCGNTPNCVLPETTTSKDTSLTTMAPSTSPSPCRAKQWQCKDGKCLNSSAKCDGVVDCLDGSDETGCSLKSDCKLPPYPTHGFYTRHSDTNTSLPTSPGEEYDSVTLRITCEDGYDAPIKEIVCVNGTWFNEMPKCDENSDISDRFNTDHSTNYCSRTQWQCYDGGCIDTVVKCDGKNDCYDKSDELYCSVEERGKDNTCVVPDHPPNGVYNFTPSSSPGSEVNQVTVSVACSEGYKADKETVSCLNGVWKGSTPICIQMISSSNCSEGQWQCVNGECISSASKCDGHYDCIDHTDEGEELCVEDQTATNVNICVVPYIENGNVLVRNHPTTKVGQAFQQLYLEVTCSPGYITPGLNSSLCLKGKWMFPVPQCLRYCILRQSPSVKYNCRVSDHSVTGIRPCREAEPVDTVVEPKCQDHYYSEYLTDMTCTEAGWSHSPICKLDCGTLTPAQGLSIGSRNASRSEVPWHVGIYKKKKFKKHHVIVRDQICGGSLISYSVLISAAHCFHDNSGRKLSERHFSVAVGKLYREWDDPLEYPGDAQMSEIKQIRMPETYHSESTYFQSDIAVVEVATPFQYQDHVKPVCLDLDHEFDERQLNSGAFGKVAGWGYLNEEGVSSPILKIVEEPIYNHSYCYGMVPAQSRPLITSDKICAGYTDGSQALCRGDSGGGLTVKETRQGIERYYLRGVVSTTTSSDKQCNRYSLTYFTRVVHHSSIITGVWSPI